MTHPVKSPKKLIEVALPLDDINVAAAREKSIRHGHPSTLHLWWARRPLAAARAVLFAQLVNDPGYERHLQRGVNKEKAQAERERLFGIIRRLVLWENTNNEEVLKEAREEIWKSWRETCALNKDHPQAAELFNPEKLPAFHDPFAGGGSIPLEAQRLGLEAYASDLNPVAVLINKAMIEIPPKFAGRPPVGPIPEGENQTQMPREWPGATGLAEDVRRYGHWMREEAFKRIGHLYPPVEITKEMAKDRPDLKPYVGQKLTVIAWIWARTVKSPNPAYATVEVPLVSNFMLCTRPEREAYVQPHVDGTGYNFRVNSGNPDDIATAKKGTKSGRGNFVCIMSGAPISADYIRKEAKSGRIGMRLMAIAADSGNGQGRLYISPTPEQERLAPSATNGFRPDVEFFQEALGFRVGNYGMTRWSDLFSSRQLLAMSTFSGGVAEATARIAREALENGVEDNLALHQGGIGARAYAEAVSVFLALGTGKCADYWNALCTWAPHGEYMGHLFTRQAIPMVWDFAEANPFSRATGNWSGMLEWVWRALQRTPACGPGLAIQADAQSQNLSIHKVVSTDPPYYDNVGYADLSDFFYVWLRSSVQAIFPEMFSTLTTPKTEELVATPERHGGRDRAEAFFLTGMTEAMRRVSLQVHPAFPVTVYYAFKQSDTETDGGTASTGWVAFLNAVLQAGFTVWGTWPMRTELANRMRGISSNALASSIVLVCRPRPTDAASISRRDFQRELKDTLPEALEAMIGTKGHISPVAPVDLAQAAIGPGMAVFSKYSAVLEADGTPMSVHTALTLINKALDEYFSEAEGILDADSQFCVQWFDDCQWNAGAFGQADVLARAKGTSVDAVRQSGVAESSAGKVRLLKFAEYPKDWNPESDHRTPVWEALHHLVRALQQDGEENAGALLARMPGRGESIRQLAYRLYTACERKGRAEDARAYNELITAWQGVEKAAADAGHVGTQVEFET